MPKWLPKINPVAAVWAALAIMVFAPAAGIYTCFPSPDSMPRFHHSTLAAINDFLAGTHSLAPHDLLRFIFGEIVLADFTYLLDTLLIMAGMALFLRTEFGLGRYASFFGGGLFAFMGYSFTLFSAGHRGFFFMTVYAVFFLESLSASFGSRGFARRAVRILMAAFFAAWAMRFQPDFAFVYLLLGALFALWKLFCRLRGIPSREDRAAYLKRTLLLFALAIACFAAAALPTLKTTFTETLGHRQEQIRTQSVGDGGSPKENQWIFATNWSLPPEEIVEFAAPAYKGRATGEGDAPYWGRLGRSHRFEETGEGFFNFRQHLVYFGAIPLSLALLALVSLFFPPQGGKCRKKAVLFWFCVFLFSVLLAFGRYAPFYRLFYSIPYMSYLRAPVKLVRIAEFSVAVLAALGLERLAAAKRGDRCAAIFAAATASFALLFFILSLFLPYSDSFLAPLKKLGATQGFLSLASISARKAFIHGAISFAAVSAAAFALARGLPAKIPGRREACAALFLAAIVAIDCFTLYRPFAKTLDAEYRFTDKNPLLAEAAKDEILRPILIFLPGSPNLAAALQENIASHGGTAYTLADGNIQRALEMLAGRGAEAIFALARITGSSHLLLDAKFLPFCPKEGFALKKIFNEARPPLLLAPGAGVSPKSLVLVESTQCPGYARLYNRTVRTGADGELLEALVQNNGGDVLVADTAPILPDGGAAKAYAKTIKACYQNGALNSVIETESDADGVLLVQRRFDQICEARVDGKRTQAFTAGFNRTGIFLPKGKHTVKLYPKARNYPMALWSAFSFMAFLALLALRLLPSRDDGAPA